MWACPPSGDDDDDTVASPSPSPTPTFTLPPTPPIDVVVDGAATCGMNQNDSTIGQDNGVTIWRPCGIEWDTSGGEYVYEFTPASDTYATIALTWADGGQDLDLLIIDSLDPQSMNCLAGSFADQSQSDPAETVEMMVTGGETIYIVVDGYQGSAADFNMSITCGAEPEMTLDGIINCGGSIDSTNAGEPNERDYYGCAGWGWSVSGGERVYALVPTADGTADISMTFTDAGQDLDLIIMDGLGLGTASCIDSSVGTTTTEAVTGIQLTNNVPVYVIVDGFGGSASDFTLSATCY
jgi:hypothetical protein